MGKTAQALAQRQWSSAELFATSLAVILINFTVSLVCPTSHILEDEIAFYDTIWRTVSGQRLGLDYHNPLGFAPFQVAALLWKAIGPYEHILKLTNTLLVIPVAWLGCRAVRRYTALPPIFALLAAIVIAFELSAPNSFGFGIDPTKVGTTGFYNRISIACLVVLFLHAFAGVNGTKALSWPALAREIAAGAMLLLFAFLFKISALAIGIFILFAAILAYRNKVQGLLVAAGASVLASLLIWLVTLAFGIGLGNLAAEYALAGKAKGVPGVVAIVQALFKDPLDALNIILVVFGLYILVRYDRRNWMLLSGVFVVCVGSTFLLNISNEYETIWLYPPAFAIMAAVALRGHGRQPEEEGKVRAMPWSSGIALVPLTGFLVILANGIFGTGIALASGLSVVSGLRDEYVVTGDRGIRFHTFCQDEGCDYGRTINEGVALLRKNGLEHEKIATLTHSNPFPVLMLAPPHRGTQVWWNFGFNVPKDAVLTWKDVLGDATVVMVPLTGDYPHVREKLLSTVQARLDSDFELVFADSEWKIYRQRKGN
ncbi:MAG: hypothetical protein KDE32_10905 [Novosphingobium sp.]|nr:hypothetical protein [Novosphingobium sp.]